MKPIISAVVLLSLFPGCIPHGSVSKVIGEEHFEIGQSYRLTTPYYVLAALGDDAKAAQYYLTAPNEPKTNLVQSFGDLDENGGPASIRPNLPRSLSDYLSNPDGWKNIINVTDDSWVFDYLGPVNYYDWKSNMNARSILFHVRLPNGIEFKAILEFNGPDAWKRTN